MKVNTFSLTILRNVRLLHSAKKYFISMMIFTDLWTCISVLLVLQKSSGMALKHPEEKNDEIN